MENYEQIIGEEYYEKPKPERDYMFKVTVCQLVLCAVFVCALFIASGMNETVRMKFSEGIEYLQRGDFTEVMQAIKGLINTDAQV